MPGSKQNIQLDHQHHQADEHSLPVCVLANDLNDGLNIGSLFRLADSFALQKLYLTGSSPVPPQAKIRKTARHTETSVAYEYAEDATDIIRQLKNSQYQIISLELTTQSIAVQTLKLDIDKPSCLIIGSENTGVSAELLALSDITIHIPMRGKNSSMNVVTATAIGLYEICNQHLGKHIK